LNRVSRQQNVILDAKKVKKPFLCQLQISHKPTFYHPAIDIRQLAVVEIKRLSLQGNIQAGLTEADIVSGLPVGI